MHSDSPTTKLQARVEERSMEGPSLTSQGSSPRTVLYPPPQELTQAPKALEGTGQPDIWNAPKSNIVSIIATFWSFLLLGMNDSSYGILLPHFEEYYDVSYLAVSLLFLSPVIGFMISTLSNHVLHSTIGRRGMAPLASASQIIAYMIACFHPPFYVLVIAFAFIGLGAGLKNASWNGFISGFENSNELLGLLHGFYGLGATILPLVSSFLLSHGWKWYMLYYVLVGLISVDLTLSTYAFRKHNAEAYLIKHGLQEETTQNSVVLSDMPALNGSDRHAQTSQEPRAKEQNLTFQCFKNKVVILCSFYLLAYVGSEVALGGWLVTFMMKVRHGSAFASGIVTSGLWAGITLGRICLGFVTGRFFSSERVAVICYLSAAMALELMFWLIPNFVSSAICVSFLGFFLGPLFPCVIVCISRLLPLSMKTVAIGICAAVGASGASIVPFLVGAIAQAKGVTVLQPIILAFLALCMLLWLCLPRQRQA
ncbi:MFS transporter [Dactylonectria macrodidyma]|uniref:MFS transporter n=1 Tax=Dactylonectria macrodidyma TaxID=307937 RepID=A0A9P9IQL4_9HYPO|nr:MFS transporter [Dactylonectria macrodidyma]